jgi:hypothetical protein
MDKGSCRRALELPEDRFIVLATSEFGDARKGLNDLLEALRQLQLPDVLLVSTSWAEPDGKLLGSIAVRRLGYIRDMRRLAMIYAAADVLVGPSLEETFGQIFIEAAACGTPAIGYPVTAVREAVKDGVTGRLTAGVGPAHLATAILELYRERDLREAMGCWGRLYVENEWSPFLAWHDLSVALRRLGLMDKLRYPPKISFLAQQPAAPVVEALCRIRVPRATLLDLTRNAIRRLAAPSGSRVGEVAALARETLLLINRHLPAWLRRRNGS